MPDEDDSNVHPTEREIRRLMFRKPFVPFVIALKSGERYPVVDRMRIACYGGKVVVIPPNSPHELFRVTEVAAIEVPEFSA